MIGGPIVVDVPRCPGCAHPRSLHVPTCRVADCGCGPITSPGASSKPSWCANCEHPNHDVCQRCGSTETTGVRPEANWGDPDVLRRHGTELYDDIAFEVLTEGGL